MGIDPKVLEALFIAPLISNHIAEAETVAGQRLDTLRTAIDLKAIGCVLESSVITG